MNFHLLFEQSGVFKNVLRSYGNKAFDYDILNEYGETDLQIDLFNQIKLEYQNITEGSKVLTIFSNMNKEKDFIIAFFPCTHFSGLNQFQYKLIIAGKRRDLNKISTNRLITRNKERSYYFEIYLKFCYIVKTLGIPTIIENPSSCSGNSSFLELFSPIPVSYKEVDRRKFGDRYKKPTNFYSINFEMEETFLMFSPTVSNKSILKDATGMKERSLISIEYAKNFYERFLRKKLEGVNNEY